MQIGRQESPAASGHQRYPVGPGYDGEEHRAVLLVQQSVPERVLSGAVRVRRPLEQVRVRVSRRRFGSGPSDTQMGLLFQLWRRYDHLARGQDLHRPERVSGLPVHERWHLHQPGAPVQVQVHLSGLVLGRELRVPEGATSVEIQHKCLGCRHNVSIADH